MDTFRTMDPGFFLFSFCLHRSTSLCVVPENRPFLSTKRQRHAWATCTTSKADAEGTSTWGFFLSKDTQRFNFSYSGTRRDVEEERDGLAGRRGREDTNRRARLSASKRTRMECFGRFAGLDFTGSKEPPLATATQGTTGYRWDMGNQCSGIRAKFDGFVMVDVASRDGHWNYKQVTDVLA